MSNAPGPTHAADDVVVIEALVAEFFAAFTTSPDLDRRMDRLRAMFLPGARIVSTAGPTMAAYSVDEFIEPRRALLSDGTLRDFSEWPTSGHVEVFGDVAHWFGHYAKKGVQGDEPFDGRGGKSIQFVRSAGTWLIAAAAWDDEPSAEC
ncbi:nuclear transport factor 2 family protein [Knoellia sp. CPCC 206453]|uniref:nuclear transport factor 2 family protein n=1 Tax=Knoellia pratensis TaxID=3404796 RepID=UPI00361F9E9D